MRKIVAAILAFAMILTLATALFPGLSSEASAQLDKSQSATNLIVVKQGETFEIAIQQPLHPAYDWLCDNFDEEYVALAGVEYEPPAGGAIGVTNKVFSFEALQVGVTEIQVGYYEFDASSNPVNLIESRTYAVKIVESAHIPSVGGSAQFTVVEPADIGDIWHNPSKYVGHYVLITGKYMGWGGSCEYGAPVTYSDWMLEDQIGCIYVSALSEGQPNLFPFEEEDLGTPLKVIALVTTTSDDDYPSNDDMPFQPYLESRQVWGVQTTTD